tara:strand:+ start:737 stop:919 length:183 start_codon:yes stop_codon:yes gene_type:complete
MKKFEVEFKDITDYKGSIIADNIEEAIQTVLKKGHYMFNNFEPVQAELSITHIEENNNES